eukprot:gene11724-biopygen15883
MVLVDTGSGLNFISQSMADSLGHDPLPCHHKTIAFNDVKSSLTKEIQMPVIFCSETPNEISVRATLSLPLTTPSSMPSSASISNQAAPSMLGRRHEPGMESYSYETNSDNTLYLGDVNLLHRIQKSYRATKTAVSIGGGINNSMPDGAVTPNADRGALHPDCDLFIGHHRDGTEAQRKEMAAMLHRMTPAVARTMEDLREGYKGIVPPMHIEKDNDKQAFTSPYRKPPIEKLAQDKVCAELLLLGFIEPAPSAQHAANPVVALKKGPDAYFQKVMETELGKRGLLKFSKVFIDDILVHSATFADHIKDMEAVLQCLIDIGLRIHPDKSCFALDAVDFLGFDVSNHGLTPQAAKVQAIKDMPYPSNLKDLKTILAPSPPLAPGRQLDTDLRLAAMSKDTEGLDIHSDQFVLEYLRRGVLGSNWTTSLPVEDWFCPNCKASGITAIPAGRIPETPQKEPNLFPTPQTRSRDRAALACDKMLVIKQVRVQGGLDKAVWGTASFQGPLSRPW